MRISAVRGFPDTIGGGIDRVSDAFRSVALKYGYTRIRTPIVEKKELFTKSVDELIASKELFEFSTRSGTEIALRPENTAGVVRALIQSGQISESMSAHHALKYFYSGPMFRYERPQKGRFRQFNQFGVEFIGESHPFTDVELIALAVDCLKSIGIDHSHYSIALNSLGDNESMKKYNQALSQFMHSHKDLISERSRVRLENGNVMRFLDSKDAKDVNLKLSGDFPLLTEYLSFEALKRYDKVREGLEDLSIPVEITPMLVRGLDYYTHTAFEFVAKDSAKALLGLQQSTILAGGHYGHLVRQLGGPDVPGAGWAAGIERIVMLVEGLGLMEEVSDPDVAVIAIRNGSDNVEKECIKWCHVLRQSGFNVQYTFTGKPAKQMKRAEERNAKISLIIGEDELRTGRIVLKDMKEREQTELSASITNSSSLINHIKSILSK